MFDAMAAHRPVPGRSKAAAGAVLSHLFILVVAINRTAAPAARIIPVPRDTIPIQMMQVPPSIVEPAAPAGSSDGFLPNAPGVPSISGEELKLPDLTLRLRSSPSSGPTRAFRGLVAGSGAADSFLTAFHSTELEQAPELLEELRPEYPIELRRAGVSGVVRLAYVVGIDGRMDPKSVRVLASDHPDFLLAALRALRSARFSPAQREGRRIPVVVEQAIRFQATE
jgi:TonB family protein